MWLVTSPSPLVSKRGSKVGVGWIDAFFDYWLPSFVDEIRRRIRGPEIAAQMHEEVISKDGVSRPAGKGVNPDGKVSMEHKKLVKDAKKAATKMTATAGAKQPAVVDEKA